MTPALNLAALVGLLLSGAIFGFFYAWVCSTMWGLDAADPRVAIAAMQEMNASVRNMTFAPAFFGTGPVLALVAGLAYASGKPHVAIAFGVAAAVYVAGAMLPTILVNVQMNEALAATPAPEDRDAAREIWQAYSPPWQAWNLARTVASGAALTLCGLGLIRLGQA